MKGFSVYSSDYGNILVIQINSNDPNSTDFATVELQAGDSPETTAKKLRTAANYIDGGNEPTLIKTFFKGR